MTEPNEEQRGIIEHSLGIQYARKKKPKPYRNHYCCRDKSPALEAMVEAGWMERGELLNGDRDRFYYVTRSGAAAVGSMLPKD